MQVKAISAPPRRGEFITRRLNGGLNYGMDFGLTASEMRDGGDFDLSESGAIRSRRALRPFTTTDLGQPVLNSWVWQDNAQHNHLFAVLEDLSIVVCTDGAASFSASVFGTMSDSNSRCVPHAWSAGGWLYVSDGYRVLRWGGVGFGSADNVTSVIVHPESPTPEVTNLGVPPNCAATTYRDTVFIGNTLVYMTDPDAVWWSAAVAEQPDEAPLEGLLTGQEDFYENQRITFIAGNQADEVTKLVSSGPGLYAFKRHSIHSFTTNGSTVLTNDLSTEIGLAGPNAVCAHNGSVFFFDEHEGLHILNGNSLPEKVFDPIFPLLDCARITRPWLVAVGFDGTRIFVSCCLDDDAGARNNTTFVLNTALSATTKGGAWSKWDVGFSSFVRYQPQDGDSSLVGFTTGANGTPYGAVRINECSDSLVDDYGFTTRPIMPWFRTAFFDDGLPTLSKQWERIALTIASSDRVKLKVSATTGPRLRSPEGCELPRQDQPTLPNRGTGYVDVDLTPYDCESDTSIPICDQNSRGGNFDNGVVYCGDEIGEGKAQARVARIAGPGRGVTFSVEVRDNGSEAAWEVDELDAKYAAIVEYT